MKVSIVGVGKVGKAIAYALVARGVVHEMVLVGRTPESARGDALDLRHASCMSQPVRVTTGDISSTINSDVVVIAAAAGHVAGDRRKSIKMNAELFRQIVQPLAAANPQAVFIVVTNPVDTLTQLTLQLSGLPACRVIGTGTLLDTMRLRALLAERCHVHPADIRAYVLGEHGESQVAAISSASVGGASLGLTDEMVSCLASEAKNAGHVIYREKGYTDYGVGLATAIIIEAIQRDRHEVLPVSTYLEDYCGIGGVCMSVPVVIGRQGVVRALPIRLNDAELDALQKSAAILREMAAMC